MYFARLLAIDFERCERFLKNYVKLNKIIQSDSILNYEEMLNSADFHEIF